MHCHPSKTESTAGVTAQADRPVSAEERATAAVTYRANTNGEEAWLGELAIQHRFMDAPGAVGQINWHYVEAGQLDAQHVLLVHGHPFTWSYWHPLIEALAPRYHVIAVDVKGYGQSDKRPGDWRPDRIAEELLALCDVLAIRQFDVIASDRATVLCDHLVANHVDRVRSYTRLGAPNEHELEGDYDYEAWHREPMWASDMLADPSRYFVAVVEPQLKAPIPAARWKNIVEQFAYPGIGTAVPRSFQESTFLKDQRDRKRFFPSMTCPVLDLRSSFPNRYVPVVSSEVRAFPPNWRESLVDGAGVYLMLDAPDRATNAICEFLSNLNDMPMQGAATSQASPEFRPRQSKLPAGVRLVENHDGETEILGSVAVTHRFVEAMGAAGPIRWHYVEAGNPKSETIVYLHGHPKSWYGGRHQIEHFADRYHIIAPDLKGYGQSDKRPGDFRHENVSEELMVLFDHIGLNSFNLVAHDRGAVQADYIGGNHPERIIRYVRMQQIGHIFLPMNSPQERLFRDPVLGPQLFANPKAIFDRQWARFKMNPIDPDHLNRMMSEAGHPGFSDAVPRYFQSSSFQKELYDRTVRLFRNMRFPVLLLQASEDVGQPRWYYDDQSRPITALFPNARLEFIEGAGHFTTINFPKELTAAIERFISNT